MPRKENPDEFLNVFAAKMFYLFIYLFIFSFSHSVRLDTDMTNDSSLLVKSGSALCFHICSNKIKSGRFIDILGAFLLNKTIIQLALVPWR